MKYSNFLKFALQQTSGADLALLMLDVLEKSKTAPTEEHIARIARLVRIVVLVELSQ